MGESPLLFEEGCPSHQTLEGEGGVVAHTNGFGMCSQHWCVSDHPVCGASVGYAAFLLMPQPPLLKEEGTFAHKHKKDGIIAPNFGLLHVLMLLCLRVYLSPRRTWR